MRAVADEMDRIGGKEDQARLKKYRDGLEATRKKGNDMQRDQAKNWAAMTKVMDREVGKQHRILDGLLLKLDEVGAKTVRPKVDLSGITQAIAQVELLERRLEALGRSRATPRVGIGGGFGGAVGGGGGGFRGGPGGQGLRSVGFGPLNFGSRSGIALLAAALPAVQSLLGATTALGGSLSGAALGAGAVGLAGGGALVSGIGALVSVAKPAGARIGEARKAQEKFNEVLQDFGRDSREAARAKRELDQAMENAPRGTRMLLRDLKGLGDFWRKETRAGQESWVGLLGSGVRSARRIAPTAARAANQVARRTEVEGGRFGRFLSGPVGRRGIRVGTGMFNENLNDTRETLQFGVEAFVNLEQAARPFLRDSVRWIRQWVRGWRDGTADITRTRDRIREMVEHFKTWRRLGGATFRLIKDLFSAGAPEGQSMVERLTATLRRWDVWVQRNPEKVRAFFRRTVNSTIELARGIAAIVAGLNNLATTLGPVLDRFSQLVALAGQLGLLTPGVGALAYGAFRGGRAARGGPGGGAGGTAAAVAAGAGAGRLGRGRAATPPRTNWTGWAPGAAAGAGGARGMLGRAGGVAKGAARGAGKAFLPVAAIMGLLDFVGTEGGVGRRLQGLASGVTLGAINRPRSRAEQADAAGRYVDDQMKGLSEGTGIRDLRGDISWLSKMRGWAGQGEGTRGLGREGVDKVKEAFTEEIAVRRALVRDLRSQRAEESREKARRRGGELREGFVRGVKTLGREGAFSRTVGQTREELGKLGPHGARALADAQLMWLRQTAKGNEGMLKEFRGLERGVIDRFGGMARQVASINGRIFVGAKAEWGRIAEAIRSQARRGVEETTEEFRRLRSVAVGALVDMGYSRGQASGIFKGLRARSGSAARRIAESDARSGPSPTQLGATDRKGDGIGDGPGGRRGRRGPGAPGLMGAKAGLGPYAADAARFGLGVSSGLRPGAVTNAGNTSFHASGDALDLSGPAGSMMRFALHAAQAYGSRLEELIYTPLGFSIKNGKRVPPYAQKDHYDHVHIADKNASGGLGGGGGGLGGVSLNARRSRLGGAPGALSSAAMGGIAKGMEAALNARLGGSGGMGGRLGGGAALGGGLSGMISAVGLPSIFNAIIRAESGGNPRARNPSGASGLTQIMLPLHRGLVSRYGGDVFDPMTNLRVAKHLYDESGLAPWAASRHAWGSGDGWGRRSARRGDGVGRIRPRTARRSMPSLGGVHVSVSMGNVTVREAADIQRLADAVGDVVAAKFSAELRGGVTDEELMD